jgi:hypothetical protein
MTMAQMQAEIERLKTLTPGSNGEIVDLESIYDAIDTSSLMMVKDAIDKLARIARPKRRTVRSA